jgi:hypothetical protein
MPAKYVRPYSSADFDLFSNSNRVVKLDTEISQGA